MFWKKIISQITYVFFTLSDVVWTVKLRSNFTQYFYQIISNIFKYLHFRFDPPAKSSANFMFDFSPIPHNVWIKVDNHKNKYLCSELEKHMTCSADHVICVHRAWEIRIWTSCYWNTNEPFQCSMRFPGRRWSSYLVFNLSEAMTCHYGDVKSQ